MIRPRWRKVLRDLWGNKVRTMLVVISIAIGTPDWDFPANKVETDREHIDSTATWCGFE